MTQNERPTEGVMPQSAGIDTWPDADILAALLAGQERAISAVRAALPHIARAAEGIAQRMAQGGKLYYAGAGTSIRIAVQDGTELPATYGIDENQLGYLIAGGRDAIFESLAEKEDSAEDGAAAAQTCTAKDALIAVAASGSTPFAVAAAKAARARGAFVVTVANVPHSTLGQNADVDILLETGPEVIAGSTRMGAGTAQKACLNLISSLVGIKLGGVYDGRLVAMQLSNDKLRGRGAATVAAIAGVSEDRALKALKEMGDIKLAVLRARGVKTPDDARRALSGAHGNLRLALARLRRDE